MSETVIATAPTRFDVMLESSVRPADRTFWTETSASGPTLIDWMRVTVENVDIAAREALAEAFAREAYTLHGVREVRLTAVAEELGVTVLTEVDDIQLDLALQRLFGDLARGSAQRWSLETLPLGLDDPEDCGELIPA